MTLTVSAADERGEKTSQTFILSISERPGPELSGVPPMDVSGEEDQPITPVNVNTYFTHPDNLIMNYVMEGAPVGTGLTLSSFGVLSGTPTKVDVKQDKLAFVAKDEFNGRVEVVVNVLVNAKPTLPPTPLPTMRPTASPTEPPPTMPPTFPPPTLNPTTSPTTPPPTMPPPTLPPSPTPKPTAVPTGSPTTKMPTRLPTAQPTKLPTMRPTAQPTESPTGRPTQEYNLNVFASCVHTCAVRAVPGCELEFTKDCKLLIRGPCREKCGASTLLPKRLTSNLIDKYMPPTPAPSSQPTPQPTMRPTYADSPTFPRGRRRRKVRKSIAM
jgi:hypothetical protein